nr:hypothetical protein [Candidatus Baldrarchaeota archaeon]
HKVGDKIIFDGKSIKGNICYSALMTLLPKIYAMRYGAEFPWAEESENNRIHHFFLYSLECFRNHLNSLALLNNVKNDGCCRKNFQTF